MVTKEEKKTNNEILPLPADKDDLLKVADKDDLLKAGVVAGLLSSSCCLLQILLNALSWFNVLHMGCAGFNKLLGPPRPYLRAATFGWLGLCWYNTPSRRRGKMLRATLVTMLLMFLPEILQTWDYSHPIIRRSLTTMPSTKERWIERPFIVHNMGCEGCESAVQNLLESSPDIEMAQVDWKSGKVSIFGEAVESLDVDALGKLLQHHGYDLDSDLTNANIF